jgi:two-component system, NtrC family, sensor kinase
MDEPTSASDDGGLRAEIVRLNKIVKALIARAEREMSAGLSDFGILQATVILEAQVKDRTRELKETLDKNEQITRDLQREKKEQQKLLRKLEDAQAQLLQSEKLASIGQLAAGVAHEINNPIGFVNSNLRTLLTYSKRLLRLIDEYDEGTRAMPAGSPETRERIAALKREIDFDFMRSDLLELIEESIDGATRVRKIVLDLRDFSRVGEVEWQSADLCAGLDSTLNLVWNEIKFKADIVKDYRAMPRVECIPSQINQVFMNILVNAAQSIQVRGTISLSSGCDGDFAWISVADTGMGIPAENLGKIFDPFFTTKPVGQGTGLGLAVSYGIIKAHGGRIDVASEVGKGTTFTIRLPIRRAAE